MFAKRIMKAQETKIIQNKRTFITRKEIILGKEKMTISQDAETDPVIGMVIGLKNMIEVASKVEEVCLEGNITNKEMTTIVQVIGGRLFRLIIPIQEKEENAEAKVGNVPADVGTMMIENPRLIRIETPINLEDLTKLEDPNLDLVMLIQN